MSAILWQHVDRTDEYASGWWVLARLIRLDDGRYVIETNTRGSVVSTEVPLSPEAVVKLREALEAVRS